MQVLRKLLFPVSLVYALIVFLRNLCYDLGVFSSKSFETPTICVGNLSVGGTGKTPMIELLIRLLRDNHKIAVLSRGYKRKSSGFVLAKSSTIVEELGDEPFQIKRKFTDIDVAVDTNRRNGIRNLEKLIAPEIILLDDAYQHRKVSPFFSILLTSFDNLYVDDWYLPTGNLRDSKSASKRAQLIIVTKCPKDLDKKVRLKIAKKINPEPHQKVIFSYLAYDEKLKGSDEDLTLAYLSDKKVTLVTGIANTEPLVRYLTHNAISFEHMNFKDHHFFTNKEIEEIEKKEFVLTTEKDYVRLKDKISKLHYIEISHQFLGDGENVLTKELEWLN